MIWWLLILGWFILDDHILRWHHSLWFQSSHICFKVFISLEIFTEGFALLLGWLAREEVFVVPTWTLVNRGHFLLEVWSDPHSLDLLMQQLLRSLPFSFLDDSLHLRQQCAIRLLYLRLLLSGGLHTIGVLRHQTLEKVLWVLSSKSIVTILGYLGSFS